MEALVLRPATVHDVHPLVEFWTLAGENESRPTDSAQAVHDLLDRDPDAAIVAECGDVLVGSVVAGWDGWRAHLYRLAVHPDYRRRGIAGRLLDAAEQRLIALGATRLDAMVLESNPLGAATWRARGYRPQQEWRRWVKPT